LLRFIANQVSPGASVHAAVAAKLMKKSLLRRTFNRFLHSVARKCPGAMTVRPWLHRLRGVKIGKGVWIGDDVYLENEYPEAVELNEGAVLAMRAIVVAHTRGMGHVILERFAYVCPGAMIVCAAGNTLRIGEGAFVGIGCVVTSSVAPGMVLAPPRSVPVGKARVPFGLAKTPEEFIAAIEPLRHSRNKQGLG